MNNQNVIIFSSIDWSTHWQIHHQLTTSLINSGHKVLFIENIGVRSPELKDISRMKVRIKSRINSTYGFKNIGTDITIHSPLFIPFPYNRLAIYLNSLVISNSIKSFLDRANFDNPIVISFLPTPSIQGIIKRISPSLVVYYCADDMARTLSNPSKLIFSEKKMFKISDITLSTSHKKYREAELYSESVHFIPAGVDIEKFAFFSKQISPKNIALLNKPIIGYIGAISEVFDKQLIIDLANYFSDSSILLVGPVFTDVSMFDKFNNIKLIGLVDHKAIASYIQSFDVALIPYLVNDFTDSVYPCKLNEYLAMGIPVVSSNLEEIRFFENEYQDSVIIAKNSSDFISGVKKILNDPNAKSNIESEKRVFIANDNIWDKRFQKIISAIDISLERNFNKPVDWKKHLNAFYKQRLIARFKKIIILFIIYLVTFQSPLAWYLGDKLIVRDLPKNADAIVVFSGNGEASYQNTSYQRRALDAVRLYTEGYAPSIYLSSGIAQSISEVKLIKLFLLSKGVPEESIYVLDSYPNSTYQNVLMVKEMLNENNVNSILFITSPYHSRRALLTWKKNAPNLDIISPSVVDTPSSEILWGIGFDRMSIILYEYLAIIHNWIKGRL